VHEWVPNEAIAVREQIFYLHFTGAGRVSYHGPVIVPDVRVSPFSISECMGIREADAIQFTLFELNRFFTDVGVVFVTERPVSEPYSTIYIGGETGAFSSYGLFLGLSEAVDVHNGNRTDKAFVFSDRIAELTCGTGPFLALLTTVIAHECGHLLGLSHSHTEFLNGVMTSPDPFSGGPFVDVAFKQSTHKEATQRGIDFFDGLEEAPWDRQHISGFHQRMVAGSSDEDEWPRFFFHFYNPDNNSGLLNAGLRGELTARSKAEAMWNSSMKAYWGDSDDTMTEGLLGLYEEGDATRVGWYLGRLAHLVQDMSVPSHVLPDTHLGAESLEMDYDNLEKYLAMKNGYVHPGSEAITFVPEYDSIGEMMYTTAEYADNFDGNDKDGRVDSQGARVERDGQKGEFLTTPWWAISRGRCNDFGRTLFPKAMEATAALIKLFIDEVRPIAHVNYQPFNVGSTNVHSQGIGLGETLVYVMTETYGSEWRSGRFEGGIGVTRVECEMSNDGESWLSHNEVDGFGTQWRVRIPSQSQDYYRVRVLDRGGLSGRGGGIPRIKPTQGGGTPVNQQTEHNQMLPDVAVSVGDKSVVVWRHTEDAEDVGSYEEIILGELAPDGTPTGTEVVVSSHVHLAEEEQGSMGRARVAANSSGEIAVVWSETASDSSGDDVEFHNSLYYRLFNANLSPVGGKRLIASSISSTSPSSEPSTTFQAPDVAINALGEFVIAWAEKTGWTMTRIMTLKGGFQVGELATFVAAVSQHFSVKYEAPAVAINDDGDFAVSWQGYDAAKSPSRDVFIQRYREDHSVIDPSPIQMNDTNAYASQPDVTYLSQGDIVLVWKDMLPMDISNPELKSEIRARILYQDGSGWPSFRVSLIPEGTVGLPAVGSNPNGGFSVLWSTLIPFGIRGRSFSEDGTALDLQEVILSQMNDDSLRTELAPKVQFDSAGGIVAVWAGEGNDEGDGLDVLSQRHVATPVAPNHLTARADSSNKAIEVTWGRSSGARYYDIYRSTSATTGWHDLDRIDTIRYTDTTVVPGTFYYYRVRALSKFGHSAWAVTWLPCSTGSTIPRPGAPAPPTRSISDLSLKPSRIYDSSGEHVTRYRVDLEWLDTNLKERMYRATGYLIKYRNNTILGESSERIPLSEERASLSFRVANIRDSRFTFEVMPNNQAGSGPAKEVYLMCKQEDDP